MSYAVRFPFEKLNQLSETATYLRTQVNNLSIVVSKLSQQITTIESEPRCLT